MADRLSALLQRFELSAQIVANGPLREALPVHAPAHTCHLHLVRQGLLRLTGLPRQRHRVEGPAALLVTRPLAHRLEPLSADGAELISAAVHFGAGDENPLLQSLPALLSVPLARVPGLEAAQQLLFVEAQGQRCGHSAVLSRLVEVLVIQLLRHAIAEGLVDSGVMAGLADARLARAISAVHAEPGHAWTLDSMAAVAGMSRARFAAAFAQTVGMPPGDYLTSWRLGLARRMLRRGLSVKQVAADVGYTSSGAFGRVFLRRVGLTPRDWQRNAAGGDQTVAA
jgi:AraC-like DNA-binding protein